MWDLSLYQSKKIPLYQKIMLLIQDGIKNGELVAGSLLPSERKLAQLLQVNRSTVIRAFDELSDRGILIRKKGSGTYINAEKWGLKTQPIINWQATVSPLGDMESSFYQKQVEQIKHTQISSSYLDLGNGDLPTDLLPALKTPELSWSQLIQEEKELYSNELGLTSLRKSIQSYLKKTYHLIVPLSEILVTSGTQQALFLITQGLLKPGDTVGIEAPSYFYSLKLFQAAGVRLIPLPIDNDGLLLNRLEELNLNFPLKMIFLNPIFQNPTGSVMSYERKKKLLDYCKLKRILIIEDDAYGGLAFSPTVDTSPIKKIDQDQQVLYVGSLSKLVGQDIRIGWMVGPSAILKQLAKIRSQIDSGLSALPQLLADSFLKNDQPTQQEHLKQTLKTRAHDLEEWLTGRFGEEIRFQPAKGGYHLYTYFPYYSTAQFSQLLQDLLNEGIFVAEGRLFGEKQQAIRFSFGHFSTQFFLS
ncbi:PLP-dependent aminotransferase family protein [Carnobacterium maltaromaticum]|uniref:aminotransferase-like domain-containing protein n=1 Tax=Carnobacterium maltaromaticum TaxID=2751 RepID=UPI0039AF6579